MGAYRKYQSTVVKAGGLAPPSLMLPGGQAVVGATGDLKDNLADRAKLAVLARFPLVAPPDALAEIGLERSILRGPSETDAQYAVRCQNAWQTWPFAGTPFGLLLTLFTLGYPDVYLMPVRGGHLKLNAARNGVDVFPATGGFHTCDARSLPALPPWTPHLPVTAGQRYFPDTKTGFFYVVNTGGVTGATPPSWPTTVGHTVAEATGVIWSCAGVDFWSQFDVLFSPVPASWNPTPPASTSDEVNRIRLAIAQWKPAWATCNRIVALVSGGVWGFPTTDVWGGLGDTWGGDSVTIWTP